MYSPAAPGANGTLTRLPANRGCPPAASTLSGPVIVTFVVSSSTVARKRSSTRSGASATRAPSRGLLPVNWLCAAAGTAGINNDTPNATPSTTAQDHDTRDILPTIMASAKVKSGRCIAPGRRASRNRR